MQRVLLFIFFILSVCIQANAQIIVFCSSSDGDDLNNGLSGQTPVCTIEKVLSIKYIKFLMLKRNNTFRTNGININGVDIKPYGKGKKPTISGFTIFNTDGCFTNEGYKIWPGTLIMYKRHEVNQQKTYQ